MKDICRAANLSPGAVYSYFASKQELIEALARESRERLVGFVEGISDEDGDATRSTTLLRLVEALERPDSADRIRMDIALWAEALRSPGVGEVLRQGATQLVDSLAEASDEGEAASARIALAVFEGLSLQKALDPELDLAPLIERLATSLARRPL